VGGSHLLRGHLSWRLTLAVLATVTIIPLAGNLPGRADAAVTGLQVAGNQILLNGQPFEPRGFTSLGVLDPACSSPDDVNAAAHLTSSEMSALAVSWKANTVRFQVSQFVLSDPNPATVTAYLTQVESAVAMAHAAGLSVILSMNDHPLSCDPTVHDLPSQATETAWANLAPAFATDPDVMFELYNEPVAGPPPPVGQPLPLAQWTQWMTGTGADTNEGATPVGTQDLINEIRAAGADNVLIADGLNRAGTFAGLPTANLTDASLPTPNIAYAVHPYFDTDSQSSWDARFGNLAATVPVIATEWNQTTAATGVDPGCNSTGHAVAQTFLNYLADRGISVLGYAADAPLGSNETTTLMADWSWDPTTCPSLTTGPGVDFQSYLAATALPRSSTVSLGPISSAPFTALQQVTISGALTIAGQPGISGIPITITRTDANGTAVLPTAYLDNTGSFTATDTLVAGGSVTYTASYAGNAVTQPQSASQTIQVAKLGSQLTLTLPGTAAAGSTITGSGTLALDDGQSPAGLPITVTRQDTSGTTTLPSVTTEQDGSYQFADAPPLGQVTYVATFAGTSAFNSSTQSESVVVSKTTPSLSITTDATTYAYQQKATVSVNLSSVDGSRTVTIEAQAYPATKPTAIGTVTVDSLGNASVTYTVTRNTTFSAVFSGDSIHNPVSNQTSVIGSASISETLSGGYRSSKGIHYFHNTVTPTLIATLHPKQKTCLTFQAQIYSAGSWSNDGPPSGCITLSSNGQAMASLLAAHSIGVQYRVSAEFGGTAENGPDAGSWLIVMFTS